MTLGPVMLNIEGCELDEDDRRRLTHPQTGGIVLFSRNYKNKDQLSELCREIHDLRDPQLIITVDHEGATHHGDRDVVQPEGKRAMSGVEYVRGARIEAGERLT